MAGAAEYRTEHVAQTPAGWHVRMKAPSRESRHLIGIAFPPGRRKKGSGRLIEILHPADERNPRCEVSRQARENPGELLIFGNPHGRRVSRAAGGIRPGHQPGCPCFACRRTRGEKVNSSSAAKRATRERAGRIRAARLNPKATLTPEEDRAWTKAFQFHVDEGKSDAQADRLAWRDVKAEFPRLKKFSGAKANPDLFDAIGPRDRVTFLNRFNQRQTGRVVMRSKFGGWVLNMGGPHGTPAVIDRSTAIVKVKKSNPSHHEVLTQGTRQVVIWKDAEGSAYHVQPYVNNGETIVKSLGKWTNLETARSKARAWLAGAGRNPSKYFAVYSNRENKNRFQLDSVETTRDAANKEATRLRREGHQTKVAGPRSDKNFPVRRNSVVWGTRRRNASDIDQAVNLYQSFHGQDPKSIVEKHVSAATRLDYTALGDLEYLLVETPIGGRAKFEFDGDGVKLASSPDGKQLYCIGGNQNLLHCLDKDSQQKDFIDLGDGLEVQYLARKVHADFRPVSYYHKFGELNGARPRLMFDKLKKQIFFIGGEYFIDTSKGVSPGIEN
jgi:hypothetical protein